MKTKKTPAQKEAMKFAYWNKWCPGGSPDKVLRTKGITNDEWYISDITKSDITKPCDEGHIK